MADGLGTDDLPPSVTDAPPATSGTGPATWIVGLLAGLAALVFVIMRVFAHDGDVTTLIRVGQDLGPTGVERPADIATVEGIGYDGQYYYRQALDPLSLEQPIEGITLDRPAYRSARIGYPALVWAASLGGQRALVPWMLPAVNIALVGVIAALGAIVSRHVGRSSWWGLLFAAWPGFAIALSYDLAEPLEAAAILAAVLALRRERTWLATAALVAAVLTRESALVLPIGIVGAALLRAVGPRVPGWIGVDRRRNALVAAFVPIAAYASMQVWMSERWGERAEGSTHQSAQHLSSVPLRSFVDQVADYLTGANAVDLYQLIQLIVIVFIYVCIVWRIVRSPGAGTIVERTSFAAALLLVSTVGGWDRMVVYFRWQDLAMMLGFVVLLDGSDARHPTWTSSGNVAKAAGVLLLSVVVVWIWI